MRDFITLISPCRLCGARVARDVHATLTTIEAGTTELLCMSCQFPQLRIATTPERTPA